MREYNNYVYTSLKTEKFILEDLTYKFDIKTKRGTKYTSISQLFNSLKIKYKPVSKSKKKKVPIIILERGINQNNYMEYYKNIKKDIPKSHKKMLNIKIK